MPTAFATLDTSHLSTDAYRFLAADGSTCTFLSNPSFSSDDYYYSPGKSAKGVYSMHLNAFFDLSTHTYTDALIQAVHNKNEFRTFCDIVDRHDIIDGIKNVYMGDRGYCSYNNRAHVINQNQYFLFRTKDIDSKGLVGNFDFPEEESFDIWVKVTLVRSHSKKVWSDPETYVRFIDQASTFDFIEYGSCETYEMAFRIVRFPISDSTYGCIVTNLPENIEQEIWANLIAYNITEVMIKHTILEKRKTKHEYKVNFTIAAHICRVFLRLATEKDQYDVMPLLQKELIPIRNEHQYPRLQTAHFRKPRYFIYRAA